MRPSGTAPVLICSIWPKLILSGQFNLRQQVWTTHHVLAVLGRLLVLLAAPLSLAAGRRVVGGELGVSGGVVRLGAGRRRQRPKLRPRLTTNATTDATSLFPLGKAKSPVCLNGKERSTVVVTDVSLTLARSFCPVKVRASLHNLDLPAFRWENQHFHCRTNHHHTRNQHSRIWDNSTCSRPARPCPG